ncbi:NAD-binding protein [Cristinia sonorae]|uniref:NAD-binding protein n=1 Tax=Cristinia sonorae TaxID=1940300 RepID=A0A8K0UJF8_9AGAR|nr:NAD-binding protein [Cristinia sonorae]
MSNTSIADYTPTVAIVTGAAKGIGRAIALRLADDGFNVAVNDIPAEQQNLEVVAGLIREKGRQAVVITGDVSVEADVEKLVAQTVEDLGGLDAMIANAGIGAAGPLSYLDVEQFDRILAVNVRGVMLCYKHAAKQMISQNRGGRLIAASSIFGKKGVKYCQAYCASKFAVRGLSQSFAEELLPHKITVNTYAPGVIRTDMTKSDKDGDKHGSFVKSLFTAKEDAPDADPEVVASLVSYLCKPEAYFINGQSMSVCGGLFIA